MTPAAIIIAAISIMAGTSAKMEIGRVLGENEGEIIEQVAHLQGSQLTRIKNTIDILAKYDLDIQRNAMLLAVSDDSEGVSYSTDPDDTIIV